MADKELFVLLDRVYRKDAEAINELVERYYPLMYRTALGITANDSDAQDVVQNASIRMVNHIASLEDANSFEPWLKRIVRNEALNYVQTSYRKKNVMWSDLAKEGNDGELAYDAEDERVSSRPDLQMDQQTKQEIILKILNDLDPRQRMVVMMRFYDGKGLNEIAEELNLPYSTVAGLLQRGKNAVKVSVSQLQEKEGIKLYNLAPLAYFITLLQGWKPLLSKAAVQAGASAVASSIAPKTVSPAGYKGAEYAFTEKAEIAPKASSTVAEDVSSAVNDVFAESSETAASSASAAAKTAASAGNAAAKAAATGASKAAVGFLASTAGKIVVAAAVAVGGTVAVRIVRNSSSDEPGVPASTVSAESESQEARPMLLRAEDLTVDEEPQPSLDTYTVNPDFSNVINPDETYLLTDEGKANLAENYFVVTSGYSFYEFYETYEDNTYNYIPSFVTTDSLLHTFHLYYVYMQKKVERDYLRIRLEDFSKSMLAASQQQLSSLSGTEWQSAAERNVDYYSVALSLLGDEPELSQRAQDEVSAISEASKVKVSELFTTADNEYDQDYSQFKPRSYYTESPELESYFRTMMWFGQMNFSASDEDLNRSALLNVLAIRDSSEESWDTIYKVTAFFAGESDDNCYYEYLPAAESAYGDGFTAADLAGNDSAFRAYRQACRTMPAPRINSMVVSEDEDRNEKTNGFRVLGQRFTIDGMILQKLVYRDVAENSDGEKRKLPTALDVPAALGSDEALNIVNSTTDAGKWPDYAANMQGLRNDISAAGEEPWAASASSAWLGSLRPLLEQHGEGWPAFMQSKAWADKDLNTFLGSYTELKHDTVLYAKQTMAEMGAAGIIPPDDRGYVEPQPQVYQKISKLASSIESGLKDLNLISDEDCTELENFVTIADRLSVISNKELNGELPSDDDFDFIRSYGGNLEHLWIIAKEIEEEYSTMTYDHPSALVTDIATDAEDQICLEIAEGIPSTIYVVVQFDNTLRIAVGSVYDYYEFEQPLSDRLTDEEWKDMVYASQTPSRPSWTESFRAESLY